MSIDNLKTPIESESEQQFLSENEIPSAEPEIAPKKKFDPSKWLKGLQKKPSSREAWTQEEPSKPAVQVLDNGHIYTEREESEKTLVDEEVSDSVAKRIIKEPVVEQEDGAESAENEQAETAVVEEDIKFPVIAVLSKAGDLDKKKPAIEENTENRLDESNIRSHDKKKSEAFQPPRKITHEMGLTLEERNFITREVQEENNTDEEENPHSIDTDDFFTDDFFKDDFFTKTSDSAMDDKTPPTEPEIQTGEKPFDNNLTSSLDKADEIEKAKMSPEKTSPKPATAQGELTPEELNSLHPMRKLIHTALFLTFLGLGSYGIYESNRHGSYLNNLAEKYLPDWKSRTDTVKPDTDKKSITTPPALVAPQSQPKPVKPAPVSTFPPGLLQPKPQPVVKPALVAPQSQPEPVSPPPAPLSSTTFETKKPKDETPEVKSEQTPATSYKEPPRRFQFKTKPKEKKGKD